MFLPEASASGLDKLAREAKADEIFIALLKRFISQGRNVGDKRNSPNYAPAMFAKEPEAKDVKMRKSDFEAAMLRLFKDNKICAEPYGRIDRGSTRIVLR